MKLAKLTFCGITTKYKEKYVVQHIAGKLMRQGNGAYGHERARRKSEQACSKVSEDDSK